MGMPKSFCRWGILGTAGIARKNWKAICLCENARVAAVASRSEDSARRFIDECSTQVPPGQPPVALGSYEALLDRSDIDAVYIPLPTALRYEWVVRAAKAGKHVLGEKPAALNATQVEEMLDVCRDHGVQYMDGVMFMHSRRLELIRKLLEEPGKHVGKIRRIASQFSFKGDDSFRTSNIRAHSGLEPYGCLGDLGWYSIRMTMFLLDGQTPVEVRARTLTHLQASDSPSPVPGEFTAELLFANDISASFYSSFVTENQQWVHLSGTEGNMRIDDFVLPYHGSEVDVLVGRDEFAIDNCEFHFERHLSRHAVREYDAGHTSAQEVALFRTFSNNVLSGKIDNQWPLWTLKTQRVVDACFQSASQDGKPVAL